MNTTDKAEVRNALNNSSYDISFQENGSMNGDIMVTITHESATMSNEDIKNMLELGYTVSCVVGSIDENDHTTVYFKELKGSF